MSEELSLIEQYQNPEAFFIGMEGMRNGVLSIMSGGSCGSEALPGKIGKTKPTEFASILSLTPYLTKHANAVFQSLYDLQGNPLFVGPANFYQYRQQMDLLRKQDKIFTAFNVHDGIPKARVNIDSAIDSRLRSLSNMPNGEYSNTFSISFQPHAESGVWVLNYGYTTDYQSRLANGGFEAARDGVPYTFGEYANMIHMFDRLALLNFYVSAEPLHEDYGFWTKVFSAVQLPGIDAETVSLDSEIIGSFRVINFNVDTEAVARKTEEEAELLTGTRFESELMLKARLVRERNTALQKFQIIALGKVEIDGKLHYVYSGADKPMVKQTKAAPSGARGWFGGLVPNLSGA